jgi:signal transduction histidine kinase
MNEPAPVNEPAPASGPQLRPVFFTGFGVGVHLAVWLLVGLFLTSIWAFAGGGFWPRFPIAAFGLLVTVHAGVSVVLRHGNGHGHGPNRGDDGPNRSAEPDRDGVRSRRTDGPLLALQVNAVVSVALIGFLWVLYLFTRDAVRGQIAPWAVWPTLSLMLLVGGHALTLLFVTRSRRHHGYRRRVAELTSRRSGVVEAQETELRRIERDLHDGAQARLVALNMQLGLMQQQLDSNPEAVRPLLAEAKTTTAAALRELRDLARGIYPPVLSDRGLGAAVASLAATAALPVTVETTVDGRLPAPIEAALYFAAAEALANATKHARCSVVTLVIRRGRFDVVLTVTDDGCGGADPNGTGLTGIRQRLEAFDGHLDVSSPVGGPTILRAEVPCASSSQKT